MALKLEKKTLEVEIYGTVYKLNRPTLKDIDMLTSISESKDTKEQLLSSKKMLMALGLPEVVFDEMSLDDFADLIDYVSESFAKKK